MASWKDLVEVLPYGYSLAYALKVEGIPYLFVETDVEDLSVSDYTASASLQISDSAKIGSVIDETTGIGRAFDLTVGIERTATTETLFKKPSNVCRLDASLAHDATTITADDTTGFSSSGSLFVGVERIVYTGKTGTTFTGATRGAPTADWRGYSYDVNSSIATWVTDGPMFWRGRRAKLYAMPVDPTGRATSGNFTTDSVEVWSGHVATDPRPYPNGWSLSCRSIDRRLDVEIGSGLSGSAKLLPNPDPKYQINPDFTLSFMVDPLKQTWGSGNGLFPYYQIQPFLTLSSGTYYHLSELKAAISAAFYTLMQTTIGAPESTYFTGETKWIKGGVYNKVDGQGPVYHGFAGAVEGLEFDQLHVRAKKEGGAFWSALFATVFHNYKVEGQPMPFTGVADKGSGKFVGTNGADESTVCVVLLPNDTEYHWFPFHVLAVRSNTLDSIEITLDDEDPANVPSAGFVTIRGEDQTAVFEYTEKSVDGAKITIAVEDQALKISDILAMFGDGTENEISVNFSFKDSGQVRDTMRRLLMSSGRGDNDATYDTLAAGQGYDLEEVNTGSFDKVLDGGFSGLSADFLIDDSTSFVGLYGHLIALSQNAIVPRMVPTGIGAASASIELCAVPTSVIETAEYQFTLTDAHLIGGKGGGSVKARNQQNNPNKLEVTLKRSEIEMGKIVVNDIVAQRADGTKSWGFDVNGFTKTEIKEVILGWARSLFAARSGRLVYELDVVPWVDCQVGDSIRVESTHFNFWNRATGGRGYTGTARVLGKQTDLKTQQTKLTIGISGAYQTMSLSPSATIRAHTTGSGSVTAIQVAVEYYDLFNAYLSAANPATLLVYNPGVDETAKSIRYNAISKGVSNATLTVSVDGTSGGVTNNVTHVTVPFTANCSTVQGFHMHTDTAGGKWQ